MTCLWNFGMYLPISFMATSRHLSLYEHLLGAWLPMMHLWSLILKVSFTGSIHVWSINICMYAYSIYACMDLCLHTKIQACSHTCILFLIYVCVCMYICIYSKYHHIICIISCMHAFKSVLPEVFFVFLTISCGFTYIMFLNISCLTMCFHAYVTISWPMNNSHPNACGSCHYKV